MDDSVALKSLANILGIINGVIPSDKKLTNEEKLDVIYGGRDEKIKCKIKAYCVIINVNTLARIW